MAGEGPPPTTSLRAARKVVDAGLRRHDDVSASVCQSFGRLVLRQTQCQWRWVTEPAAETQKMEGGLAPFLQFLASSCQTAWNRHEARPFQANSRLIHRCRGIWWRRT